MCECLLRSLPALLYPAYSFQRSVGSLRQSVCDFLKIEIVDQARRKIAEYTDDFQTRYLRRGSSTIGVVSPRTAGVKRHTQKHRQQLYESRARRQLLDSTRSIQADARQRVFLFIAEEHVEDLGCLHIFASTQRGHFGFFCQRTVW